MIVSQFVKNYKSIHGILLSMQNRYLLVILGIVAVIAIASIGLNQTGKQGFLGTGSTFSLFGDSSYGTGLSFNTVAQSTTNNGVRGNGEIVDNAYYLSQQGNSVSITTKTPSFVIGFYEGGYGLKYKVDAITIYWWTVDMWSSSGQWVEIISKNTHTSVASSIQGNGPHNGWRATLSPNDEWYKVSPLSFILTTSSSTGIRIQLHANLNKNYKETSIDFIALKDEAYIAKTDAVEVEPIETVPGTGTTLIIKTIPTGCSVLLYNGHGFSDTKDSGTNGATFTNLPANVPYATQISKSGYKSIQYEPIAIPGIGSLTFQLQSIGPEPSPPSEPEPSPPDTTPGTGHTLTIYSSPFGATVHLFGSGNAAYDQGTLITDANGATWYALPTATYRATIEKEGYLTISYTGINIPGVRTVTISMTQIPQGYSLTIKTNPYGCDVHITGTGFDDTQNSGTIGAIFENIPQQQYTATISKEGYKQIQDTIPKGTLSASYPLTRVNSVEILTNPNANVQVYEYPSWIIKDADDQGYVLFDDISSGTHKVSISKAGLYSNFFTITVEEGENQFVLSLGSETKAHDLQIMSTPYGNSKIELEGYATQTTDKYGETTFYNVPTAEYHVIATSTCGEIQDRIISFPNEHYISFEFSPCMGKGGSISYKLKVITIPSGCTAHPEFYNEQNTGVDGATWFLQNGDYNVIVSKDGYDTKTVKETINGRDDLIVVRLQTAKEDVTPVIYKITGPSTAGTNELVTFTVVGDREKLYYSFDFGDGSTKDWSRSYVVSHVYTETGVYTIKVKAKSEQGLEGQYVSTSISVQQIWKLFTPQIIAYDITVGELANFTVLLPTNLGIDNYYLQVYVRTAKGEHIVPRWTTLENTFNNGTIIGYLEFRCNESGKLRIGAQGIAMEPLYYHDTQEVSVTINCNPTGVTSAEAPPSGTAGTGGGLSISLPNFATNYVLSISIVAILAVIVIIALVFLIIRRKR
jgi:hypothetical protein